MKCIQELSNHLENSEASKKNREELKLKLREAQELEIPALYLHEPHKKLRFYDKQAQVSS